MHPGTSNPVHESHRHDSSCSVPHGFVTLHLYISQICVSKRDLRMTAPLVQAICSLRVIVLNLALMQCADNKASQINTGHTLEMPPVKKSIPCQCFNYRSASRAILHYIGRVLYIYKQEDTEMPSFISMLHMLSNHTKL